MREPLPLSLLNDFLYCPRRAALKVVKGLPLIAGMLSRWNVSTIHCGCCDKTPDLHGLCQTERIPWAVDRWVGAPAPARRPPAKAPCRIPMPKSIFVSFNLTLTLDRPVENSVTISTGILDS